MCNHMCTHVYVNMHQWSDENLPSHTCMYVPTPSPHTNSCMHTHTRHTHTHTHTYFMDLIVYSIHTCEYIRTLYTSQVFVKTGLPQNNPRAVLYSGINLNINSSLTSQNCWDVLCGQPTSGNKQDGQYLLGQPSGKCERKRESYCEPQNRSVV